MRGIAAVHAAAYGVIPCAGGRHCFPNVYHCRDDRLSAGVAAVHAPACGVIPCAGLFAGYRCARELLCFPNAYHGNPKEAIP